MQINILAYPTILGTASYLVGSHWLAPYITRHLVITHTMLLFIW